MDDWVWAVIAVGSGLVGGTILAWLTRFVLRRPSRREEIREIATPVAAFFFWVTLAAGVIVAVATAEPETIEDVPADLLAYLPRVLAAGLILLAGRALGIAVAAGTARSVARATGRPASGVGTAIKVGVNLAAVVLALAQLGVDTTVLVVLAGGVVVGGGLAFGLLVGLGGRDMAREIAAGRYLRRHIEPGSHVRVGEVSGSVTEFHPAGIEVRADDGRRLHVPHSHLLGDVVELEPTDEGSTEGSTEGSPGGSPDATGATGGTDSGAPEWEDDPPSS